MSKKQKLTHGSLEQQDDYQEGIIEISDNEEYRENYIDCENCIEADEQLHDLQCHLEDLEDQNKKLRKERTELLKKNKSLMERLKAKYNDKLPNDIC